jgi:hydrogenase maturation protein HypF
MGHMVERVQIIIKGIVQGVGFRPSVYNLAESLDLKGYVTNTSEGVLVDIEGTRVSNFVQRIRSEAPSLSRITDLTVTPLPHLGFDDFTIRTSTASAEGHPFTLVSPDVSTCHDCLRELLNPTDRRYLYPFINCTNCGPRYSITTSVPYDRSNTTMASFAMCPECQREYQDPADRRFHAQPNACATCGPQVEFRMRNAECGLRNEKAIKEAVTLLKNGGIVAIKGIGGFHLACDAANDEAVRRLRERKRKSNKPFAVMARDIDRIGMFCTVSEQERAVLLSDQRPIVLLRKRCTDMIAAAVSPNNHYIGCMLPYTPLHNLLFMHPLVSGSSCKEPHFKALVMTSGNLSEEPIVRDNDEALQKLSEIVDGFLLHDRDIFMRVDDSVVRVRSAECGVRNGKNSELDTPNSELMFMRRSRGYAPDPIVLHDEGPEVLGCGADLKNTFTLTKGTFAIVSQHIGDMENYETVRFFEECLANLKAVYRAEPTAIVHDLHPGYLSTQWAIEAMDPVQSSKFKVQSLIHKTNSTLRTPNSELMRFSIQHHYAHIGSVMAEHGLTKKVIGVALDGTGYGTDGNLWGGEFLLADIDGFDRVGQFKYVPLPGGETAIREPWKTAVSYVMDAAGDRSREHLERAGFIWNYGRETIEKVMIIAGSKEFSPLASGAGRLFDAVSALLGVCDRNTFEGEAAMALEALVQEGIEDEYRVEFSQESGCTLVEFSPLILAIIADLDGRAPRGIIAAKFHNTVVSVIRTMVRALREQYCIKDVALSGGTFQNSYVLKRAVHLLSLDGVNVFINKKVPCNDACISLGQAYLVRERLKKQKFSSLHTGEDMK